MNRRDFGPLAAAVTSAVFAAAGCGGKIEEVGAPDSPSSLASFEGVKQRVYFGMTNDVASGGSPALATFDLVAGANVELEVVTRDSSPLEFELRRIRRDGTQELIEHVNVESGFHLGTFVAPSPNTYALYFPERAHVDQTFVVHFACNGSGEGPCTPKGQPDDFCSDAEPCDEGLTCDAPAAGRRGLCTVADIATLQ